MKETHVRQIEQMATPVTWRNRVGPISMMDSSIAKCLTDIKYTKRRLYKTKSGRALLE